MTQHSDTSQSAGTEPPDLTAGDPVTESLPVRVLIIDDDPMAVNVLVGLLREYSWIEVAGTAFTLEDGYRLTETVSNSMILQGSTFLMNSTSLILKFLK